MTARALAVIALAAGLSHPAGAQAVTPATVHAPGGPFLTDDAGRRLELHGVNLVPECGPHTSPSKADGTPCLPDPKANEPGWYLTRHARDPGRRFTDADAETLRSLGIDVVRLGIHWEAMEPGPPGIGANDATYCRHLLPGQPHDESLGSKLWSPAIADRYLGHVDREIRMLERHHLEVILDMHSGAYSNFFYKTTGSTPWLGHGAPLWATCDDNIPFTPPDAWNSSYFTPAVADAADHFWSNDVAVNMQEEYIRTWTHVVRRYAGSKLASGIIGYEIANEPVELTEASPPAFDRKVQCDYAGSDYAPASCASSLPATHPQQVGIIPSIQQVDPKRLVFYEPPILTGEGSPETIGTGEPLPFDGLVLSFHSYATDEANFNEAAAARAATMTKQPGGPAWMNTEFGASDLDAENSRAVAQADQHLVPWTYWAALQMHDPTGGPQERLIDDRTRKLIYPKACLLAGAHPTAVAGTLTQMTYDSTSGQEVVDWTPDPKVHAPTLIEVPSLRYSAGYRVQVTGGRVASRRRSGVLAVVAAGTGAVQVTVTPRDSSCPPRRRRERARGTRIRPR